jgi:lysozyme
MTPGDYRALIESIQNHEGFFPYPSPDTDGHLVLGWGQNLHYRPLTPRQGWILLEDAVQDDLAALPPRLPFWNQLNGPRQRVLAEMAYQMGVDGVLKFRKTLAALERGDYLAAADEMLDSKWALETRKRAEWLSDLMKRGTDLAPHVGAQDLG